MTAMQAQTLTYTRIYLLRQQALPLAIREQEQFASMCMAEDASYVQFIPLRQTVCHTAVQNFENEGRRVTISDIRPDAQF